MPLSLPGISRTSTVYRPNTAALRGSTVSLDEWLAPALDANGTEWWATGLDGWWGGSELRGGVTGRPQDDGANDARSYLGSKPITITGTCIAQSEDLACLARDTICSLLSDSSTLFPLVVTERSGLARQCGVRLANDIKTADVNEFSFDWQLSLVAPDPRRYAVNETVLPLSVPASSAGGLTAPFFAPFTVDGAGTATDVATAWNAGTIAVRPIVEFIGPLTDPLIQNVTAGRTLTLGIDVAAGDYLLLDFDRRSILLNGTASRANAQKVGSAWFELAKGANELRFTSGGGGGSARIRFRSAWK